MRSTSVWYFISPELPRVHFGPFDKTERVLVDANTEQPLLKQGLPNDALANIEVLAQGDLPFRKFNRPRGCEDAQVPAYLGKT